MDNPQDKKAGGMGLDYEQLLITNEFGEIIRWHNQCLERLKAFRTSYPYLMAPNVAKMMEENVKENVQMLYREFNNLHKPKTEQRRHVCRECHSVFAVSLPGGICDECRSRGAHLKSADSPPPRYPGLQPRADEPRADVQPASPAPAEEVVKAEEPAAAVADAAPAPTAAAVVDVVPQAGQDAATGGEAPARTEPAAEAAVPPQKAVDVQALPLEEDEPPGDER